MNHRLGRVALIVSAAVVLAACGSKKIDLNQPSRTPVAAAPAPVVPASPAIAPSAVASGTPQSQVATVDLSRQGAGAAGATGATGATGALGAAALTAPAQRIVYFDFDSFALRDEFTPMLEGHARALAASPARRMMIEGHTDERGGREYNLALGQKRAEAVLRSLVLLGATEGQLEAVSFGKERPAAEGSNEAAWAQNRRAELKDR